MTASTSYAPSPARLLPLTCSLPRHDLATAARSMLPPGLMAGVQDYASLGGIHRADHLSGYMLDVLHQLPTFLLALQWPFYVRSNV